VTALPLLVATFFARASPAHEFRLGGLLAGSMTDPPALMFATNLATSEAPALAYVTFYPLTTLLRILAAQGCSPAFAEGGRA
jgi:putative transport protein